MELEELNSGKNGVEKDLAGKKAKQEDQITDIIGVFGPYQAVLFTIFGLTIVIHNWQMLSNKFYTNKTDFWCSRPSEFANFSVEDWRKLSAPWKSGSSNESDFDNCKIFNVNFSTISIRPEENTETIPCTSWEYDTELFDVSLNTY